MRYRKWLGRFHPDLQVIAIAMLLYALVSLLTHQGVLNQYWCHVLDLSLITACGALGLSLVYGFAGQFSLGHAAFYGIGAYTAGVIGKVWGQGNPVWFVIALLAGTITAGMVSLAIGAPILRLRSDYLGIATLGFGIIVKVGMDHSSKVFEPLGGATGMTGTPQVAGFTLIFWCFVCMVFLMRNTVASSFGRACMAVREDEVSAGAMGIDSTRIKVSAFAIGCAVAGFSGGLYAYRYPYLHPSSFDFLKSFDFLLVVVLGGLGSLSGTIVTAVGWVFLLEALRIMLGEAFIDWRGVIYALILIATILVRSQGLFGGREWRLLFWDSPGTPVTQYRGVDTRASADN